MKPGHNRVRYTAVLVTIATSWAIPARSATIHLEGDSAFPSAAPVIAATPAHPGLFAESTNASAADQSLAQSFQSSTDFLLETIYIRYAVSSGSVPVSLSLYSVADVEANHGNPPAGTNLIAAADQSLTFAANDSSTRIARIVLSEPVPIAATTGTNGYLLHFSGASSTFPSFQWYRTGNTAGNVYAGGAAFESGLTKGTGTAGRDYVLALVPEPSSLVLLGLLSFAALLSRGRRT